MRPRDLLGITSACLLFWAAIVVGVAGCDHTPQLEGSPITTTTSPFAPLPTPTPAPPTDTPVPAPSPTDAFVRVAVADFEISDLAVNHRTANNVPIFTGNFVAPVSGIVRGTVTDDTGTVTVVANYNVDAGNGASANGSFPILHGTHAYTIVFTCGERTSSAYLVRVTET